MIPLLNPDGAALGRRTNGNDVDLNRNWPTANWQTHAFHSQDGPVEGGAQPLSEPEARALFDYALGTRPAVVLMLHCCGGLVEANEAPAAAQLAQIYSDATGLAYIEEWGAHPITGQFIDAMELYGIAAVDIEMDGQSDTAFAAHRTGIVALMYYLATNAPAGAGVQPTP